MSSGDPRQQQLRSRLGELGFDDVRFAAIAAPEPRMNVAQGGLQNWLAAGMHADMHWIERSVEKRLNPDLVLPGARSIILLGVSYWTTALPARDGPLPSPSPAVDGAQVAGGGSSAPRWARYALYEDYHDTMKPALIQAGKTLESLYDVTGTDYRYYVDTGPVLERGWAARAGLGFVGKNAMLISRTHGNWLFLASILTRLDLNPDPPVRKTWTGARLTERPSRPAAGADLPPIGLLCGKCTRCLDVCPTNAFAAPGVVDARRCVSYQTIENRGLIPRELRLGIGDRIYGCDACLDVCPWNRFAREGRRLLLASRRDLMNLSLTELLSLTPERFAQVFRRTPIKRLKLVGLLRNACVVAGNSGDQALLPSLITLATSHDHALVRAHAVWAVFRLGAGAELETAREREPDPMVRAEYEAEALHRAEPG